MERVMEILTDKEQPFTRTIILARIAAHRASWTRVVGIHFDGHAALQRRFISDHAMQLGKSPLRLTSIGLPLLLARTLSMLAPRALADIGQIFQSNETVGVLFHNALTHHMIGVLLQPSLSSAHRHQATASRTSAFLLKTLFQSCVVVGFGNNSLPGMEGRFSFHGATDRQVPHTHLNPCHTLMGLWGWLCHLNLKGDEQVELFVGLVIPELSRSEMGTMFAEVNMLGIRRVGTADTP